MLSANVFNTEKTDYGKNRSLFFGQPPGLFDTIHRNFPEIWEIYKNMKSLDWDELEFGFASCNTEFKTRPQSIVRKMIMTLAWQWEADSVASRTLLPILAPFISAPELQAAAGRITDNEVLHATTYSEIVRLSFDDPEQVLKEVLEVKQAMQRLELVNEAIDRLYRYSHEYALGLRKDDDETYDAILLFVVAMLLLERVQFMASFAVTFAIGEIGAFMPIAKAVQKICQDEYEVHVALDKAILRNELKTERGRLAFERIRPTVIKMIEQCVETELMWVDKIHEEDEKYPGASEELPGVTPTMLKNWVYTSIADVCQFMRIKSPYPIPKMGLPYMARWVDISKTQASPQEQENGQYKVNVIQRNDEGKSFGVDF